MIIDIYVSFGSLSYFGDVIFGFKTASRFLIYSVTALNLSFWSLNFEKSKYRAFEGRIVPTCSLSSTVPPSGSTSLRPSMISADLIGAFF